MGVGPAHDVHQALDRTVLARCAMERVEHHIGLRFGQTQRDLTVHVDPRDLVALGLKRLGHALARHERDRTLA